MSLIGFAIFVYMKKLPIGQQDFENLISRNSIYVDKTRYILSSWKPEATHSS